MRVDTTLFATKARRSSAIAAAIGAWLIVSPFLLAYSAPDRDLGGSVGIATADTVIVGLIVLALAGFHASKPHRPMWPALVLMIVSVWLFLSPMFLGFTSSSTADANAVLAASMICTMAVGATVYTSSGPETSSKKVSAGKPA